MYVYIYICVSFPLTQAHAQPPGPTDGPSPGPSAGGLALGAPAARDPMATRTSSTHCAACKPGYKLLNTSCQAAERGCTCFPNTPVGIEFAL